MVQLDVAGDARGESVSPGITSEWPGCSSTSSKVSANAPVAVSMIFAMANPRINANGADPCGPRRLVMSLSGLARAGTDEFPAMGRRVYQGTRAHPTAASCPSSAPVRQVQARASRGSSRYALEPPDCACQPPRTRQRCAESRLGNMPDKEGGDERSGKTRNRRQAAAANEPRAFYLHRHSARIFRHLDRQRAC